MSENGPDLARRLLAAARDSAKLIRNERKARPKSTTRRGGEPRLLGDALSMLAHDQGWDSGLQQSRFLASWAEIVGSEFAEHVQAESLSDQGKLLLRADSTAWATQSRLLADDLLRKLEEHPISTGLVKEIRILAPAAPSWRKGERHVRGRGPRDTYG